MYPGADYGRIYPESAAANQQFTQGIDPDWTQLAMMYGFTPNPYPAAGTEGQDQMRFMATLKAIADAQLGGAGGRYAQMSPNNPIASMPFGMRQYMTSMAPIFQSVQGRNLMPLNQADMFGGGYAFGGIDTGQESGLMRMLRSAREGGAVGQTQAPAAASAPTANAAPSTTEGQAAQVTGENTPEQTTPPAAAAASAPQTTSAQEDIRAGLEAANGVPSLAGKAADREDRIAAASAPDSPLADAWAAFLESREKGAQAAKSKELDFWQNPLFKDFAAWVRQQTGTQRA